ncbi:MAG: vitamin transporter [Synergistaceae bacterium]|nr:vitamin transporter [Synergistaceae bacterium]
MEGKKKAALLVLVFAAVLFVASVSAAEEGEEVVILEPEIVTGSRIYTSLEEIPAPTYVIDREEIERSGARGLNEILAKIPGIYTHSRNAKSQQVDVKIRGLATELLVLVDGAPYHTGTYISPGAATDLRSIPLEEIERIEIVKGAGSALYGSMAAVGVINIITRKMEGSGMSILGETGTNDWKKGSINGWTTEGDFGVRIWYSKSEEGETPLSVYNPSGRPASANDGVVDKSLEYDEESAGLKLQKGPLTFNASWGEHESRWTYWQVPNRQENEFSRFNLKWEEGPNRFMVYRHKHESVYLSPSKSIYDNKAWGAEFSQRTTWGDSLVSWGTAFRKEDIFYDEDIPVNRDRTNYAPFLEVSRPVGDLLLNLGLRYEIWDQDEADDYDEFVPKLSFLYQTPMGNTWYLSAGKFFAMPSVYQLFGSPVYDIKPNYDLKPEKGYSYEFGVKGTDRSGPWNVGLFYMTMDDKIDIADDWSEYVNIDDYRAWGIEASRTWSLNELWDLSLGATWMRAEEKTETSSTWTRSTVPEWDVNATLAYGRGPWAGELTVNYFGNRNEGNVESDVTTVDALLEYRFDASTLRLSVYNLFDEEYWQTEASDMYYYGPERRVYLTLERIF